LRHAAKEKYEKIGENIKKQVLFYLFLFVFIYFFFGANGATSYTEFTLI